MTSIERNWLTFLRLYRKRSHELRGLKLRRELEDKPLDHLLIVRAFACFCVIVHHTVLTIDRSTWTTLANVGSINFSWLFIGCPQSGVFVFFVLSGYLMGKGFAKGRYRPADTGKFYWRRFFRIVPAYLFYILCAFTLEAPLIPDSGQFRSTLFHLLTFSYPTGTDAEGVLLHLWTISTEMQFYLLVPLIAYGLSRFAWKLSALQISSLIIVCLAAGVGVRALGDEAVMLGWTTSLHLTVSLQYYLDIFVAGMLLSHLNFSKLTMTYRRQSLILFGSIGVGYVLFSIVFFAFATDAFGRIPFRNAYFLFVPTMTAIVALGLIYLAERINASGLIPGRAFLFLRPLEYAGTLTFSIYLWHWLFVTKVATFTAASSPLLLFCERFVLMLIATVVMAAVSYGAIEKPFMKLAYPGLRK